MAQSIVQGESLVFSASRGNALRVADVDALNQSMSLTLTVNAGSLSLSNISDLSVAGNGTSYLTLRGSVSQLNAALGYGLTYRNNDGFSGMDVLNIQTSDLGSTGTAINTDSDSVSIEVVAAPTAPTATNLTQTRVYLDGTTGIRFSNIVISDPDVTETISASLTLSNPSHGLLTANDGATYDSFTGVWTVTGTVAQVNAAFANVQFQPASFVVDDTIISVRIQDASSMGPSDGTITLRRSMLNAAGDSGAGIGYGHVTATDGNRIVVGARLADGPSSSATGAVFVYERFTDGSWIQTARLTASDASPSDFYGRSVAVDGDMIVVGSQMSEASGVLDTGAIYAYRWNGSAWVETKLVASDLAQSDQLGMSVAISGNNIVVGSILDDPKGTDSGSAYVFSWDGTTFTQTAKL
ncbi:MAG: FG-GAP repeat protein, partial [Pirellula sp.]